MQTCLNFSGLAWTCLDLSRLVSTCLKLVKFVCNWLNLSELVRYNIFYLFFAERDENGHRWILQIRNCGPRQAGKYSAVARNRNGTCTRSWHLHLVHPNEITKSPNPNGDESEVNKSQQIESRDQEQPSSKEALKPSAAVVFQKEVRLWQYRLCGFNIKN